MYAIRNGMLLAYPYGGYTVLEWVTRGSRYAKVCKSDPRCELFSLGELHTRFSVQHVRGLGYVLACERPRPITKTGNQ